VGEGVEAVGDAVVGSAMSQLNASEDAHLFPEAGSRHSLYGFWLAFGFL
jgi:hypothetical protein